jgi:hypothetical protein
MSSMERSRPTPRSSMACANSRSASPISTSTSSTRQSVQRHLCRAGQGHGRGRCLQVQAVINAKKDKLTYDDARALAERALEFKRERGRLPSLTSQDAWERKMAEGVAFLQRHAARPPQMAELSDLELLAELGVDMTPEVQRALHARYRSGSLPGSRTSSGLSAEHSRAPQHGDDRDIFERLYAVRLDQLRGMPEARDLLAPLDAGGLLDGARTCGSPRSELDDDALLAELGIVSGFGNDSPSFGMSRRARKNGQPRKSPTVSPARISRSSRACSIGCRPTSRPAPGRQRCWGRPKSPWPKSSPAISSLSADSWPSSPGRPRTSSPNMSGRTGGSA